VPEWGTLVHEPGHIQTKAGSLSQVFTPFFRVWERTPWTPWPTSGDALLTNDPGDALPKIEGDYPVLDGEVGEAALPGERGALARLDLAVARADTYDEDRNTPSVLGTSQLSIDLRFGTLSPRRVAQVVGESTAGRAALVRQLAWRDWYAHMLIATPTLVEQPMKPQYAAIQWRQDDKGFEAWKNGRTGYPFVDAGMRQLRETGWMHNRVRMVTASFLVKNLLIDWRRGERYFRHVLVPMRPRTTESSIRFCKVSASMRTVTTSDGGFRNSQVLMRQQSMNRGLPVRLNSQLPVLKLVWTIPNRLLILRSAADVFSRPTGQ
jgi:deoxyribodipyrimidine photo-lyase